MPNKGTQPYLQSTAAYLCIRFSLFLDFDYKLRCPYMFKKTTAARPKMKPTN